MIWKTKISQEFSFPIFINPHSRRNKVHASAKHLPRKGFHPRAKDPRSDPRSESLRKQLSLLSKNLPVIHRRKQESRQPRKKFHSSPTNHIHWSQTSKDTMEQLPRLPSSSSLPRHTGHHTKAHSQTPLLPQSGDNSQIRKTLLHAKYEFKTQKVQHKHSKWASTRSP